jgi:hypothetical protein
MKFFADYNIGSDECHGLVRVLCDDDADHAAFYRTDRGGCGSDSDQPVEVSHF